MSAFCLCPPCPIRLQTRTFVLFQHLLCTSSLLFPLSPPWLKHGLFQWIYSRFHSLPPLFCNSRPHPCISYSVGTSLFLNPAIPLLSHLFSPSCHQETTQPLAWCVVSFTPVLTCISSPFSTKASLQVKLFFLLLHTILLFVFLKLFPFSPA